MHYDNPDQPHKMGHMRQIFDLLPNGWKNSIHFLNAFVAYDYQYPLTIEQGDYSTFKYCLRMSGYLFTVNQSFVFVTYSLPKRDDITGTS